MSRFCERCGLEIARYRQQTLCNLCLNVVQKQEREATTKMKKGAEVTA